MLHIRPPQLIKQGLGTGAKRAKGKRACWKHYHNLQRLSFRWAPLLFPTLFALTLGCVCVCVFLLLLGAELLEGMKNIAEGELFLTLGVWPFSIFFPPFFEQAAC